MGFHLGWEKNAIPELEAPTELITVRKGKERVAPVNIDQMDAPPVVAVPHMSIKPPGVQHCNLSCFLHGMSPVWPLQLSPPVLNSTQIRL